MAITLSRALANTYFGVTSHVNYGVWFSFTDDQQDAAITHATRLVNRALGYDLTTDTTSTPASYRPDYAVYEQALYMLVNSNAIADGTQTGPKFFGDDGTGTAKEKKDINAICKDAQEWLDVRTGPSVAILRGA
ncbi:MAG: hypothetical protein OEQ18_00175 [Gammaproteobacteria bacterium]|nr:hypothetical protein [Gammaproteobacteria bacterium]